jgi:hypothetical protein
VRERARGGAASIGADTGTGVDGSMVWRLFFTPFYISIFMKKAAALFYFLFLFSYFLY